MFQFMVKTTTALLEIVFKSRYEEVESQQIMHMKFRQRSIDIFKSCLTYPNEKC